METSRDDLGIVLRSAFLNKNAKQKFSLISLIIISIILLLIENINNKPLDYFRYFLRDSIYKSAWLLSTPKNLYYNLSEKISDHFYIIKKNEILEDQLSKYKNFINNQNYSQVIQNKLNFLLKEKKKEKFKSVNATVILDKDSPFIKSIILNKGRKHGIKKGMSVIDNSIFIGRVVESNFLSSRVLLITDLNSKIPVLVGLNRYHAILSGIGNDNPIVEFLPKNYELNLHDVVYTSGKDGVLPPGIQIGEIISFDENPLINLFSNFNQLSYVNIVIEDLGILKKEMN